jgi:alkanesulfonate monooxygenase SsuD/methylene tetrahydromethanopterin reductase-like flavin-dependent oxidoreductase (luciferase family)
MYAGELKLAELAERLGYDSLWAVEHHFDDYAMCPDNVVLLANIAEWYAPTSTRAHATGPVTSPAEGWSRHQTIAAAFRRAAAG